MRFLQPRGLFLPALSIVAVVLLMLVIIGVSTFRNMDREKQTTMRLLEHHAISLLNTVESGARAGMMMPSWQEDPVEGLIREVGRDPDIAYIYLMDPHGNIVYQSENAQFDELQPLQADFSSQEKISRNVRQWQDGTRVYELAKPFSPIRYTTPRTRHHLMHRNPKDYPHIHSDAVLVLGLKMDNYEQARKADVHHAILMAGILLALGTGAVFFVFVIQNFYLVRKTLKQHEDYTARVVESMPNGLVTIDGEGKIISYNPLALKLLEETEATLMDLDLAKHLDLEKSGMLDTLEKGTPVLDREVLVKNRSGQEISLAVSATPIQEAVDQAAGAVILLRDLTEIKKLQAKVRRSEKLAAMGKLAASVAHEIRNPLSSIRGFAKFLAHSLKENPKEQQYAETMVTEVDRINRVITDLLTYARPMETQVAPTDLEELIDHTSRLIDADARSKKVTITKQVSPDLQNVLLDANQMTQALLNLMLNALHSVKEGGSVAVGAKKSHLGKIVEIWVEDDGPGIPEEDLQKIFDPFYTTREKGTGLGLAIVQKIVEHLHGEIRVESPPQGKARGSRFAITIPAETEIKGQA